MFCCYFALKNKKTKEKNMFFAEKTTFVLF